MSLCSSICPCMASQPPQVQGKCLAMAMRTCVITITIPAAYTHTHKHTQPTATWHLPLSSNYDGFFGGLQHCTLLPQGLFQYCSFNRENPFPRYLQDLLPYFHWSVLSVISLWTSLATLSTSPPLYLFTSLPAVLLSWLLTSKQVYI